MNSDFLHELHNLLEQINLSFSAVTRQAQRQGISPFDMRLADGSWVMPPLLNAKALVLNSLVLVDDNDGSYRSD